MAQRYLASQTTRPGSSRQERPLTQEETLWLSLNSHLDVQRSIAESSMLSNGSPVAVFAEKKQIVAKLGVVLSDVSVVRETPRVYMELDLMTNRPYPLTKNDSLRSTTSSLVFDSLISDGISMIAKFIPYS